MKSATFVACCVILSACSIAGDPGKRTQDDLTGSTLSEFPKYEFSFHPSPTPPKSNEETAAPTVSAEQMRTKLAAICTADAPVMGVANFRGEVKAEGMEVPEKYREVFEEMQKKGFLTLPVNHQIGFCTRPGSDQLLGVFDDHVKTVSFDEDSRLLSNGKNVELLFSINRPDVTFQELPTNIRTLEGDDGPIFVEGKTYRKTVRVKLDASGDSPNTKGTYEVTMDGDATLKKFFQDGAQIRGPVDGDIQFASLKVAPQPKPVEEAKKPEPPAPTVEVVKPEVPKTKSPNPSPSPTLSRKTVSRDRLFAPVSFTPVGPDAPDLDQILEDFVNRPSNLNEVRTECHGKPIQRSVLVRANLTIPRDRSPDMTVNPSGYKLIRDQIQLDAKKSGMDAPDILMGTVIDYLQAPQEKKYLMLMCSNGSNDTAAFVNIDAPELDNSDLNPVRFDEVVNHPLLPDGDHWIPFSKKSSEIRIDENRVLFSLTFKHKMTHEEIVSGAGFLARNALKFMLNEAKNFPPMVSRELILRGILDTKMYGNTPRSELVTTAEACKETGGFNMRIDFKGAHVFSLVPFQACALRSDPSEKPYPLNLASDTDPRHVFAQTASK